MIGVGVLDAIRMRRYQSAIDAAITGAHVADPSTYPITSPWSSSDLQRIVFEDVYGSDIPVNTRSSAMAIPAIARGRNLIVSTISQFPLAAATAAGPVATPQWMTNSIDGASPQHRLAWTVDDLIFYGWSCWTRENYADGNFPRAVRRVNQGDWTVNADNQVEVDGIPQPADAVILIPGLHEGILTFGASTLNDARSLYQIVRDRLASPLPNLDLHQTGGQQLTDAEIDTLLDRWALARKPGSSRAGVGYTSQHIEAKPLSSGDENLMIEARNAASLDLARLIGVTAGLIDATAPKASLNYETTSGRNQEFVDRDLALYMTPITARLSLDDVMPHGQRAVFNLADFTGPTPSPTGPALED